MKRMSKVEEEVIQAIIDAEVAGGRIYYQYPPDEVELPCLAWYRTGIFGERLDGEWIEKEAVMAVEIYSNSPLDGIEEALDDTVGSMRYHATKEQSTDVPPRAYEIKRFRRRVQYRFYWNF